MSTEALDRTLCRELEILNDYASRRSVRYLALSISRVTRENEHGAPVEIAYAELIGGPGSPTLFKTLRNARAAALAGPFHWTGKELAPRNGEGIVLAFEPFRLRAIAMDDELVSAPGVDIVTELEFVERQYTMWGQRLDEIRGGK